MSIFIIFPGFDNLPIGANELLDIIRNQSTRDMVLGEVRFSSGSVTIPGETLLADELAAFANSRGGVCVLGVDDSREVLGIPLDRLDVVEEFVREICISVITPPLAPVIERLSLPCSTGEMLPVLRIEVPRSLFVHRSPGGYLHRVGSAKHEMPPDYLARLFQQRSQARIGPKGPGSQFLPSSWVAQAGSGCRRAPTTCSKGLRLLFQLSQKKCFCNRPYIK